MQLEACPKEFVDFQRTVVFRCNTMASNPIFLFHKIGIAPFKTLNRGLYLDLTFFRSQLQRLQTAGYRNGSLDESADLLHPNSNLETGFQESAEQGRTADVSFCISDFTALCCLL